MTSLCIENDLGPWRKEWLLTIVHLCEMYDIAIWYAYVNNDVYERYVANKNS